MAKKTNTEINGQRYYRITRTIGRDKNGKPIKKQFYGTSKRDAELKYLEWKKQNDLGLKLDSESLSQAMFSWLWEIEKYSGIKASTFDRYESLYRNYIEASSLGYMIVNEIDRLALQRYYNKLHREGKSHSVIENVNKVVRKFFNYALAEGFVLRNPCTGLKFDSYKIHNLDPEVIDEGEVETFSEEEIDKLLNAIKNNKLRILVKFALGTGLRQGEILSLRTSDIKDGFVTVNKSVKIVRVHDSPEKSQMEELLTRPKTKGSIRKVPLPTSLEVDLKRLDIIRKEEKLKLGELYQDNDLLFPSSTGTYMDARNLRRAWERVFKHTDVPYKPFHALRHTYATMLLKKGSQLITVSKLLGHSTVQTTEIYAHVLESTKQEEVETLNEILNGY